MKRRSSCFVFFVSYSARELAPPADHASMDAVQPFSCRLCGICIAGSIFFMNDNAYCSSTHRTEAEHRRRDPVTNASNSNSTTLTRKRARGGEDTRTFENPATDGQRLLSRHRSMVDISDEATPNER